MHPVSISPKHTDLSPRKKETPTRVDWHSGVGLLTGVYYSLRINKNFELSKSIDSRFNFLCALLPESSGRRDLGHKSSVLLSLSRPKSDRYFYPGTKEGVRSTCELYIFSQFLKEKEKIKLLN